MGERGEHVVSSADRPPDRAADRKGCPLWLFGVFALFLLLAVLFDRDDDPPPGEPEARTAVFSSADANAPQLAFTLSGGNYRLVYDALDNLDWIRSHFARDGVFVADFRRGASEGDLVSAQTIIVIGNANLWVGDVAGRDRLLARFDVERGRVRTASFDYRRDGSTAVALEFGVAKRIFVVGTLNVGMGAGHGESERRIDIAEGRMPTALRPGFVSSERVLELEPGAAAAADYHKQRIEWMSRRAAEDAAKQAAGGRCGGGRRC